MDVGVFCANDFHGVNEEVKIFLGNETADGNEVFGGEGGLFSGDTGERVGDSETFDLGAASIEVAELVGGDDEIVEGPNG